MIDQNLDELRNSLLSILTPEQLRMFDARTRAIKGRVREWMKEHGQPGGRSNYSA